MKQCAVPKWLTFNTSTTRIFLRILLFSFFLYRAHIFLSRERDDKEKGGADTLAAFYPHPSPMTFDNLCRNKEAKAKTWEGPGLWLTHPKEAFEDVLVFLWGNANAKILHADGDSIGVRCHFHQDGCGLGSIFYGVGEQIDEDLADVFTARVGRAPSMRIWCRWVV
jgi:hypothetical protein